MGCKLSSLSSKKKVKKQKKKVEISPRTAQAMYDARQSGKLIYPPVSSLSDEAPKRSVLPDGGLLYKPINMNWGPNENRPVYENTNHRSSSNFPNYYNQYDNGTFAVIFRQPMNDCNIYRV